MNIFNFLKSLFRKPKLKPQDPFTKYLVDPRPYSLPVVPWEGEVAQQKRFCVSCIHSTNHIVGNGNDAVLNYSLCLKFKELVFRSAVSGDFHAPTAQMMRGSEKFCGIEGRHFLKDTDQPEEASEEDDGVLDLRKMPTDRLN